MTTDEHALLAALVKDPADDLTLSAYCDWLEGEGRHEEAGALRVPYRGRRQPIAHEGRWGWWKRTGMNYGPEDIPSPWWDLIGDRSRGGSHFKWYGTPDAALEALRIAVRAWAETQGWRPPTKVDALLTLSEEMETTFTEVTAGD